MLVIMGAGQVSTRPLFPLLRKSLTDELKAKYPDGTWVTMHGRHVFVSKGRIVPETAIPGMGPEHHMMARNLANKVMAEAARAPGATAKASPEAKASGQRGWLVIPKAGNDTFEHKDKLGYAGFGGQWFNAAQASVTKKEEGWHIPTEVGSKHYEEAMAYFKQHGLRGGFVPDEKAPAAAKAAEPVKNPGVNGEKISREVYDFIDRLSDKYEKGGMDWSKADKQAAQEAAKKWDVPYHEDDRDSDIATKVRQKAETGNITHMNYKQTLAARDAKAAEDRKGGLKIEVKLMQYQPGTALFGIRFTGYDNNDATHRSFKNLVKKTLGANNYQNGVWWVTGKSGPEMVDKLKTLREKFGPMMEFSDMTKKGIEKHDPEFFGALKATGDRAAAGVAAQSVETPMKVKGLRKTRLSDGEAVKPHGYQWSGVHYLASIEKGVLGFDTGLGKTLTSLLAAEHAKQHLGAKGPTKIIVPATRLYGWQDEINDFFEGKKVVVIDGGPEERKRLYKEAKKADYVVMSYATMTNEGAIVAKEIPGDIAIYDEAHYLKDPKSARSKAAYLHGSPKYTWWLTATPAENNLDETYRAMEFMNPGVFGEKKLFVQKFALKQDAPSLTGKIDAKVVGIKPQEKQNFRKLIAPYFFMLDKENDRVKIAMPALTKQREKLDMDPHQAALYNALRGDILATLDGASEDGGSTLSKDDSMHILTKILRLEQLAINPKLIVPLADGLGFKATNPALKAIAAKDYVSPKLSEAADTIATNWERSNSKNNGKGGKGSIVYAQSPTTLNDLKAHLKKQYGFTDADFGIVTGAVQPKERKAIEDRFNRGEHKVFLATKAANEGMNLQKNSNLHIDLDYEWNPSKMKQRIGRGYRQGQKEAFHHQQYLMRGSIEEAKVGLIERKANLIADMFDGGDSGELKAGSLSLADLYQLLGADPTKVAKIQAAAATAISDRATKRGTRNEKAAAREVAADAKAAAAPEKKTRKAAAPAAKAAAPAAKQTTAERRAERANSRAKPAQGYGSDFKVPEQFMPGNGAKLTVRERPMFSDSDLGKTPPAKQVKTANKKKSSEQAAPAKRKGAIK